MLIRRSLWPGAGGRVIALVAAIGAVGVMIGVASLVLIVSVMNAAEVRLASQVGGVDGHLSITRVRHELPDWQRVMAVAVATPGVTAAIPSLVAPVMASVEGRAFAGELQGVRGQDMPRLLDGRTVGIVGSLPKEGDEAAIGMDLAMRLGVGLGDALTVSTVSADADGLVQVRAIGVRVRGIIDSGVAEYDSRRIVLPIEGAGAMLRRGGIVSRVDVRLADAARAEVIAARLKARLHGTLVRSWQQMNASLVAALRTEKVAMATIVSIVTLVALFNIVGSLTMMVRFRAREIAIWRTMGMTRGAVARVIVTVGAVIGLSGGAAGLIAGLALVAAKDRLVEMALAHLVRPSVEMQVLLDLPLTISGGEIGWIVGAIGAGVLASTAWPAMQAASVEPAVVLRGS